MVGERASTPLLTPTYISNPIPPTRVPNTSPQTPPQRTGHELLQALPAEVVVALAGLVARLRRRVQLLQPSLFLGVCVRVGVRGWEEEGKRLDCVIDTTSTSYTH